MFQCTFAIPCIFKKGTFASLACVSVFLFFPSGFPIPIAEWVDACIGEGNLFLVHRLRRAMYCTDFLLLLLCGFLKHCLVEQNTAGYVYQTANHEEYSVGKRCISLRARPWKTTFFAFGFFRGHLSGGHIHAEGGSCGGLVITISIGVLHDYSSRCGKRGKDGALVRGRYPPDSSP